MRKPLTRGFADLLKFNTTVNGIWRQEAFASSSVSLPLPIASSRLTGACLYFTTPLACGGRWCGGPRISSGSTPWSRPSGARRRLHRAS
ncbi:uncharacterized protein BDZ99DRAFT_215599 [Mytilinidion resinicola]|uniref:Uncharacterized protein n=1 Tax=Mytilinidion resinicola TaxID=574789 RepID=A0A6A6XZH3_9PEZI|nr:uncharacterized protein BDZ99DRAFT_215599 [Mytilinidion resinicola]KAF2801688.1 hypothetical protein BDZ99DRAFT_215599 [Mytilinidion resinicola]